MSRPRPAREPDRRRSEPVSAEARQAKVKMWLVLVVITIVVAAAALADSDASPLLKGVLVTVPVLELMIAAVWWRTTKGGTRRR